MLRLCRTGSARDDEALQLLRNMNQRMDQMAEDIAGLQASEGKLVAAMGQVLAKYDDLSAQLKAALANVPPDNSAEISAIIADMDAHTAAAQAALNPPTAAATSTDATASS